MMLYRKELMWKIINQVGTNKSRNQKGLTESKISMKSIYLGIRILADVPVWPLAMVFAEAFKE